MFNKKRMLGVFIFLFVVILGFLKVNIINTKSLSPIGNTQDNYEMVSEEFGEDFGEFIKDGSPIKIYTKEDSAEDTTIRILDKELRIRKENPIVKAIFSFSSDVYEKFNNTKNKVYEKLKGINSEKEINNTPIEDNSEIENNESENKEKEVNDVETQNSDLDKIVDDFINNREKKQE